MSVFGGEGPRRRNQWAWIFLGESILSIFGALQVLGLGAAGAAADGGVDEEGGGGGGEVRLLLPKQLEGIFALYLGHFLGRELADEVF